MRFRSVKVAILLSVLCAGAAAGCFARATQLRGEASWLLERGAAEGAEYANTFENFHADAQAQTLAQRWDVLESAHTWQSLQLLLILAAVLFGVAAYALFLFEKLQHSLESVERQPAH